MSTETTATVFARWRERNGFSQRQAAKKLGVTHMTYCVWEQEKSWGKDKEKARPPSLTAKLAAAAIEAGLDPIE